MSIRCIEDAHLQVMMKIGKPLFEVLGISEWVNQPSATPT